MKKCRKILFILVAAVFTFALFALTACGGGGGGGDEVSIALNKSTLTLEEGKSGTLTATVENTEESVVWTISQGNDYITITPSGNTCTVNAVAAGTAKVKAAVGEKSAECTVTVTEAQAPVVTITLSPTAVSLTMADAAQTVTATVTGTTETVTWTATGNCVTLTPNGNTVSVAPAAIGTGTLKAEIGSAEKEIPISVTKAPATLTLDMDSVELDFDEDKLEATVTATVANNVGKVEWTIGNEEIATIVESDDGLTCTVTAKIIGETTLTASVDGGEAYKTIAVIVNGTPTESEVELELDVENNSLELLTEEQKEITATVKGMIAVPTWTITSGEDVVSLSAETGKTVTVTALQKGDAVISVVIEAFDIRKDVTLNIHVEDPTTITLSESHLDLVDDGSEDSSATVTATVTGPTEFVTWEIVEGNDYIELSDTTDTNTITVTAKAVGTAKIRAYIGDDVEEFITVTVFAPVTLTIDNETLDLKVGGADGTITATVDGTTDPITYQITGDAGAITVTQNDNVFTVHAVAEGTATITISVGGKHKDCVVTVTDLSVWTFSNKMTHGEANNSIWHQVWHNEIYENMPVDIVVKVNGEVANLVEPSLIQNGTIQVHIWGSKYDSVEITFTFKNDEGAAIAKATYEYEGVKEVKIDSKSETVSQGESTTISITEVNGKTDFAGLQITWTITDVSGTNVASIPEDSHGTSVVVSALSVGTAKLTCTVDGVGEVNCAIKVVEGEVEIVVVTITDTETTEKYKTDGEAIAIRLGVPAELVDQVDKDQSTVTVTMDGQDSTITIYEKYWGGNNLYFKMKVQSDWSHDYVFSFSIKNSKGEEIAVATHKEIAPATLTLNPTKLTLVLDGATGTVTATKTSKVQGDIEWTIEEGGAYIQIQASEDKLSVTVTAVAEGTAIIKASVDGLEKTCEVTVLPEGQDPQGPESDIDLEFEMVYGDWWAQFKILSAPVGFSSASFDYVKVYRDGDGGTQVASNYFVDTNIFQVYCAISPNNYATEYKFEFIKGGQVVATVYWTYSGSAN